MINFLRYLWSYIKGKKILLHHYSGIGDYFSFTFEDNMKLYLFPDRDIEAAIKSLDLNDAKVTGIFLSLFVKDRKLKHAIVTEEDDDGIWPESDQKLLAFNYFNPVKNYLEDLYEKGYSHPRLSNKELLPIIGNCDAIYESLKRNEFRTYEETPSIINGFTWRIGLE